MLKIWNRRTPFFRRLTNAVAIAAAEKSRSARQINSVHEWNESEISLFAK